MDAGLRVQQGGSGEPVLLLLQAWARPVTISITIRVGQTCRYAMEPRFQGVRTPWKSGFVASCAGLTADDPR